MTLNYLEIQVLLDNCTRDDLKVLLQNVMSWDMRPSQVDTVTRRQKSEELFTALVELPEEIELEDFEERDFSQDNFEQEIVMFLRSCAESRPHRSKVWPSLVGGVS